MRIICSIIRNLLQGRSLDWWMVSLVVSWRGLKHPWGSPWWGFMFRGRCPMWGHGEGREGVDDGEVRVDVVVVLCSAATFLRWLSGFLSKENSSWLWGRAHYGLIPLVGADGGGWDRDGVGQAEGACVEGEGSHVGDTLQCKHQLYLVSA